MTYRERRKEQAQRTEAAILDAALTLMREAGFEAVTVRDICKKAGITTGAFYHHFQSKEELFDKGFAPLDQYMEKALEGQPADDPAQRLKTILCDYTAFMENCGELTAQYYQRRLADPTVASMDASRYIQRALIDCFRQAQEQGIPILRDDPEWTADFCYCHFRGVVIDWLLHNREYSLLDKMMDEYALFELIFHLEPSEPTGSSQEIRDKS